MLGVESVQFSLHQGREVKLHHFLSRTLFGMIYVRGRERSVFLHIRVGKLSYSIVSSTLFGTLYVRGRECTVSFTSG